jgi:hypothetical protein
LLDEVAFVPLKLFSTRKYLGGRIFFEISESNGVGEDESLMSGLLLRAMGAV